MGLPIIESINRVRPTLHNKDNRAYNNNMITDNYEFLIHSDDNLAYIFVTNQNKNLVYNQWKSIL